MPNYTVYAIYIYIKIAQDGSILKSKCECGAGM